MPESAGEDEAPRRTRLELMREEGLLPVMPEAGAAHLARYLFEAGPVLHGAMGPVPLSHGELRAWMDNVGLELTPWEIRTLRRLSAEYAGELQRAAKVDCPPPTQVQMSAPTRADVAKRMKRSMRRLVEH